MTKTSDKIYEKFLSNKEEALEFFAIYSRFECALKCGHCQKKAKAKNGADIQPYWREYADYLETKTDLSKKIKDAAEGFGDKPPQVQIVGGKGWKDAKKEEKEMLDITLKIRRVRNNLFHGGKFVGGMGWYDNDRDQKLIKTCLKILYTYLDDENPVTKAFYDELGLGEYGNDDDSKWHRSD